MGERHFCYSEKYYLCLNRLHRNTYIGEQLIPLQNVERDNPNPIYVHIRVSCKDLNICTSIINR